MASEPRRESGPRLSDDQAAELGARILRALRRQHGGWARALRAAKAEALDTLVAFAFEKGAVSAPSHVLEAAGRMPRLAAAVRREGALAVLRDLEDAGVRHAAMKGFAVAPRYGSIHLRRIADVDILLGPGDLGRTEDILARRGYRVAKRDAIEVSFEPPPGGTFLPPIDVHVRLSYEGQFDLDTDEMLGRASRMGSILVLSPEDAVLVASSDAARDCFMLKGRSMTDIAVLAMASAVDWGAVTERARRYGLVAAAWVALSCARRVLGAPVPACGLSGLEPSPVRRAYLRLWLDTGRLSPYRLTHAGATRNDLRFAMAALWPALVDGPWRRALFVARYVGSKLISSLMPGSLRPAPPVPDSMPPRSQTP